MQIGDRQEMSEAPAVPAKAKQGAEAREWVEASIWTERMLAALENGVKGGKWYSLIDKVVRLQTLEMRGTKWPRTRGVQV